MQIEPNDLLLFARVAEAGSFSRAAARAGLPKSTVSRRVAALEGQLGERLLLRTTRKLTLTDLGRAVLDHARVLADEVDATGALAQHRQARPAGRLRVSMTHDIADTVLAPVLADFVARYPQVTLDLDLTPRRVDLIGEGFDLALRWGELPDDATLAARRLCTVQVGLFASPEYLRRNGEPAAPDALSAADGLLLPQRDGRIEPWTLERLGSDPPQRWQGLPKVRALVNSPSALLKLAAAGLGVIAAAQWLAEAQLGRGELVRVLPDWCLPPVAAWLVFPGRRLMPAKTRVFVEAVEQALKSP